ncbi:hypothetical protein [Hymenobacter metallicola]|uniref:DUF3828 domain-containing protein n=1 Tax=Hymenobacter metallicola TaxID=2563114 RepID=A0A4Z0QHT3_9BACT|nr:hypothetical protein [Hymenobacter metallicola]TGE29265.1 hypothetical protein E5K02_07365 [Hymenobacter metallicola]
MKQLAYALLLTGVAACNGPASAPETAAPPQASPPPAASTKPDTSSAPAQTVRRFIKWYARNGESLPGNFVLNDDGLDSTKFYTVNFPGTEEWLTAVQQSGTVSAAYLNGWRAYFRSYADTLRLHPQNDGPPAGFDYDLLMLSQEPDTKVAELQVGTCTVVQQQPGHAKVQARGPRHENWQEGLNFELSQGQDGRWLIDRIDNDSM